ncbi:MAG: hypothetical protein JWP28_2603 [Phenylobacterium sp.]|jgi:hypothetical protein|uniref:hypothetical protein n=1 Tax=Phenylobacterium sp. TaxID=1871053 RepID=UPI0026078817|nr:hypothetical protein [Phenylobacterium sp.]MDB5498572.1 hypothetical protein [Phenylobacterium sp.]
MAFSSVCGVGIANVYAMLAAEQKPSPGRGSSLRIRTGVSLGDRNQILFLKYLPYLMVNMIGVRR